MIFTFSCAPRQNAAAGDEHNEKHEDSSHEEGLIHFTDEQAKAAKLQTEVIEPGQFRDVLKTGGRILPAQGDQRTIAATIEGTISLSNIAEGCKVSAGQTVAKISTKSLAGGDQVAKAKAEYDAARIEYDRASELVRDNIISKKEFEQSRLKFQTSRSAYEAYSGNADGNGVSVKSGISGYIRQLKVSNGEFVTLGQTIATVSRNRRLQLRADVSEKYFSKISDIRSANFKTSGSDTTYSLDTLNGKLLSFGRATADESYFIPILFEFDNTGDFVPGSYAEIYLQGKNRQNVISIPESALTEEQGVCFVYLKIGKEAYRKQEVGIGESDGIRREITRGLKQGDRIVTEGTYEVKLAAVSGLVPEGHTHNH